MSKYAKANNYFKRVNEGAFWQSATFVSAAALLCGFLMMTGEGGRASHDRRQNFREALQDFNHPYWKDMLREFNWGASVGAGLGGVYVITCAVRRRLSKMKERATR